MRYHILPFLTPIGHRPLKSQNLSGPMTRPARCKKYRTVLSQSESAISAEGIITTDNIKLHHFNTVDLSLNHRDDESRVLSIWGLPH